MPDLNSPVLEITQMEELENLPKPVLIKFYLPTCPACRAYAPHFEKAAKTVKSGGTPVMFVQINGNDERAKALIREFKVSTFPTTFLIKKNGTKVNLNAKNKKSRHTSGELIKIARAEAK